MQKLFEKGIDRFLKTDKKAVRPMPAKPGIGGQYPTPERGA